MPSLNNQMPIINSEKNELRRCIMHLWRSYNGLGLILKHDKSRPGYPTNLIRDVEIGSPAHYAGVLKNDLILKIGPRIVEYEKFDLVLKLIRDQLKKEKRIDLLLINLDYYQEFKQKYDSLDLNNPIIISITKNYQSPLYNPNTTVTSMSSLSLAPNPDLPPEPRLCHLLTWSNYDGYGFYVAYNQEGCFVKNVEPNSPAQLGGLRDYDRIIEIDGKLINHTRDRDIIMKLINKHKSKNLSTIKSKSGYSIGTTKSSKSTSSLASNSNYLDIFVADPHTYKYLNDRKVFISTKNKGLKYRECYTPAEFQLNELKDNKTQVNNININNTNTNNLQQIYANPVVDKKPQIIIKRCKIRRLKGREDEPLGFEMTKRGNNSNFISRIEPGSSADLSGLEIDDYIIELNDKNVESYENSLLKEKIFKNLEPENGGEFRFTTVNKAGYEECLKNNIKLHDLIQNNLQQIKYYETPIELSSIGNKVQSTPDKSLLPRLCVIQKRSESDELGISIARIKNHNEHIISDVIPGSLADLAGVKQNDCLLEVNGENVEKKTHNETIQIIADLKRLPNAKIQLLVVEKPEIKNLTISLNKSQSQAQAQQSLSTISKLSKEQQTDPPPPKPVVSVIDNTHFGNIQKSPVNLRKQNSIQVMNEPSINVYPEIKICEFLGYPRGTQLGLVVTSDDYSHDIEKVAENSPAAKAGLLKGDVIIEVNDQNVEGNPSSIELLNDFNESRPLKVLAASRYAYEWSKLLKIKITEKDWPNVKKYSTKFIQSHNVTLPVKISKSNQNSFNSKYSYDLNSSSLRQNNPATSYKRVISSASTIRSEHYSVMSNLSRSAVDITADGKVLRLCTLILDPTSPIPTDSEFGFDLVTKVGNNQRIGDYYIDTVDMYSPACCSGLKPGDRIIEVDGIDVSKKTFEEVVQLINEAKLRCKLKLLVYPSVVINYGNPTLNDFNSNQQQQHQNSLGVNYLDSKSMPDLNLPGEYLSRSVNKTKNRKIINKSHEYDSIYYKKTLSKSNTNLSNNYSYDLINNSNSSSRINSGSSSNILRPVPRLCTIYKPDGYFNNNINNSSSNIGFGVHNKAGSSIIPNYMRVSIVNYKSPAYLSGLETGDFIVEINGRNTLTMSQEEALHFIKSSYDINNYVKLLVVNEYCFNWLKDNDLLNSLNSNDRNTYSYADYLKTNYRYVPRLCKIRLYPFSKSFGFSFESLLVNNTPNKNVYSHVVNKVDRESPAFSSSLQKGDRIIEIDGLNVENETHKQISDRIYQAFMNTKQINLFVVDPETDNFFKSKCIRLHSLLPIVQHITNSTDI